MTPRDIRVQESERGGGRRERRQPAGTEKEKGAEAVRQKQKDETVAPGKLEGFKSTRRERNL